MSKHFEFKKLSKRFIFYFITVGLMASLIVGLVSYYVIYNLAVETEVTDANNILKELETNIDAILTEKETIAIKFDVNENVQRILSNGQGDEDDRFEVYKLVYSNEFMSGNHSLILSDFNGNIYSDFPIDVIRDSGIIDTSYAALKQRDKTHDWVGVNALENKQVYTYARIVRDLTTSEPLGIIIINLDINIFSDIFKPFSANQSRRFIMVNHQNTIFYMDDSESIGKQLDDIFKFKRNEAAAYRTAWDASGKENLLFSIENKDYTLISEVLGEDVFRGASRISLITIIMTGISVGAAIILSIVLALRIVTPINTLIKSMESVHMGNLDVQVHVDTHDEISMLADYYNSMITRLKKSFEEVYAQQKARRKAEMSSLVAQIMPHFLYNTLSSIIWLANDKRNDDVIEMTDALSKFFRISISKGKSIITIDEELQHVQSYITIQRIRYEDMFSFVMDIDERIKPYSIPKLVLQPLIENAIYHGIKNMDEKGMIILKGYMDGQNICFEVLDSGNQMTEEKIASVNDYLSQEKQDNENDKFGIGVWNVNERIKLYCGNSFGLTFSRNRRYTIAKIVLPRIEI